MARHPLPEVIAHRGASAYAPENTIAAYDLAVEQGADVLELDVRATADGELILMHDATLLRTAGDATEVSALTAAAMRALAEFARPPSVEEVLSRYSPDVRFLIDIKDPNPDWELRVTDVIERHGLRHRALVQSFDLDGLRRLRRAAPEMETAALFRRRSNPRAQLAEVASFVGAIGPWHGAVDADFVSAAHGSGLAVRPWTVDDPDGIRRLAELGVDGVITNAPDVARGTIDRAQRLAEAA